MAIYNLATGNWTLGPNLPFRLKSGKVIPTENSFLIVGGSPDEPFDFLDTVLEFDPATMGWIVREEAQMGVARYLHFAVEVDEKKFCTNGV